MRSIAKASWRQPQRDPIKITEKMPGQAYMCWISRLSSMLVDCQRLCEIRNFLVQKRVEVRILMMVETRKYRTQDIQKSSSYYSRRAIFRALMYDVYCLEFSRHACHLYSSTTSSLT
mmetsp:Transcript_65257/g.103406  ORF Transcript_65257/g.103406 Transcript_65257/m.103406 type:complete len:117 (+) Transcript_65257:284-634(+)